MRIKFLAILLLTGFSACLGITVTRDKKMFLFSNNSGATQSVMFKLDRVVKEKIKFVRSSTATLASGLTGLFPYSQVAPGMGYRFSGVSMNGTFYKDVPYDFNIVYIKINKRGQIEPMWSITIPEVIYDFVDGKQVEADKRFTIVPIKEVGLLQKEIWKKKVLIKGVKFNRDDYTSYFEFENFGNLILSFVGKSVDVVVPNDKKVSFDVGGASITFDPQNNQFIVA
ncbi:hypothetical protein HN446_05275 [bacterium]|jgi:hypothetical protein|nr:hypothetical protein [bacterium]